MATALRVWLPLCVSITTHHLSPPRPVSVANGITKASVVEAAPEVDRAASARLTLLSLGLLVHINYGTTGVSGNQGHPSIVDQPFTPTLARVCYTLLLDSEGDPYTQLLATALLLPLSRR